MTESKDEVTSDREEVFMYIGLAHSTDMKLISEPSSSTISYIV